MSTGIWSQISILDLFKYHYHQKSVFDTIEVLIILSYFKFRLSELLPGSLVRINQLHHGLEFDKSLSLDDIIQCLEQGKPVKSIFINRRYIHTELRQLSFLRKLGYEVHEVNNPYRVEEKRLESQLSYQFNY
jgi:hypothetical protein